MKKIHLIIVLIGLFCFSCSDFLEEEPKAQLDAESDFQVPAHAYSAVNSLYRNGAPQLYDGGSYNGAPAMLGNYMSGFFDNEYKGQEIHVQQSQQLTLNGNNLADYLGTRWADMYRGISRANNAIKNIPTTPGLTEAESNRLNAEAKFFRALNYYFLVRMFGPVPLVTEPYESLENLYVERSSVADVYALIEEDLRFAVDQGQLPEVPMVENGGRITKPAAETLLADVYLTMSSFPLQANKYAEAATAAKNVIASNVHSLVQHDRDENGNVIPANSAYNKLRKSDNSAEEYIYYREYSVGIATASYNQWTFPVSMAQHTAYAVTNGAYQPRTDFLEGYNVDKDLRIQEKQYFHSSLTLENGNVEEFALTPYIWLDEEASFETASSGKDIVIYGYADVLLTAAEAIAMSEGVTPEAVDYLAQVRGRAYWEEDIDQIKAELGTLSAEDFVEEVWKERYRELVFEFKLWFDIIRTRKFPVTENGEINFEDLVGQTNSWGKSFETKHLLFPLPEPERQRNPSLGPQNPGYGD